MARKSYSEEFRRSAVDLYATTDGATIAGIAEDLGVTHGTLSAWVRAAGVPIRGARSSPGASPPPDPGDELARLRARVAELEANERTLATERDILRAAAKYFAGEMNW
jgi:transposase